MEILIYWILHCNTVRHAQATESHWHQQLLPSENCLNVFAHIQFLRVFALLVSSPPNLCPLNMWASYGQEATTVPLPLMRAHLSAT